MIIFLNEEGSYISWVSHHPQGFVLDWLTRPTRKRPVIHRAQCAEVRKSKTKSTHWTTGRHLKACAHDVAELIAWAASESGAEPLLCEHCQPTSQLASDPQSDQRHLTRLGRDVVDYVVEVAVIYLDDMEAHAPDAPYQVTIRDIANYLNKTTAQLSSTIQRLLDDHYLQLGGWSDSGHADQPNCLVYPTEDALRTLPAFRELSSRQVQAELKLLCRDQRGKGVE